MKKIVVNKDACIGCGACVSIDDKHFSFNDEGLSEVISNEDIESVEVTTAIESCPTNAISIEEDSAENSDENCKCDEACECDDNCNCTKDDKCCNDCSCGEVESN